MVLNVASGGVIDLKVAGTTNMLVNGDGVDVTALKIGGTAVTITTFGRSLIDDTDAAAAIATLGALPKTALIDTDGQTLSATDSGKVLLAMGGPQTYILPTPVGNAGVHFSLITATADSHILKTGDNAHDFYGQIYQPGESGSSAYHAVSSVRSKITLGAAVGQRLDVISDGSYWVVTGIVSIAPTLASNI
jgi:hypothetical protein